MSIEIKEIEKDTAYTVNGKSLYKDANGNWVAQQELTAQESAQFAQYRAQLRTNRE